eukprot:jgi/Mesvir1/10146/Mv02006-RA.1
MQASHQAIWKRGGPHPLPSRGGNRDIDAAPTAATAFCGIRDPPPYDPDPTGGENNVAWSGDNNSFGFSVNDRSVTYPPRMDAGVDKAYVVKAPDGDESAFRRITQGDGKCMFNALLIVDAFRKGETVTSEQVVQRTRALKEEQDPQRRSAETLNNLVGVGGERLMRDQNLRGRPPSVLQGGLKRGSSSQPGGRRARNRLLVAGAAAGGEAARLVERARGGGWGDPSGCRLGARWGARSPHSGPPPRKWQSPEGGRQSNSTAKKKRPEYGDKEVAQ